MKAKILITLCLLSMATLVLAKDKKTAKNPLNGTSWILKKEGELTTMKHFTDCFFIVYVTAEDGTVIGQHSGKYSVDKNDLVEETLHVTPNRKSFKNMHAIVKFAIEKNMLKVTGKLDQQGKALFFETWERVK